MFTEADKTQMKNKGIDENQVLSQIEKFKQGMDPMHLQKAAVVGDGILRLNEEESAQMIRKYESYAGSVSKFVPASGAASRMFKHLFEFKDQYQNTEEAYEQLRKEKGLVWDFFKRLDDFAFYGDLKTAYEKSFDHSIEEAQLKRNYGNILEALLEEHGLNYGSLPKGLLKFHRYENEVRTASHEQLVEGVGYAEKNGSANLHFTVSMEHQPLFEKHLSAIADQMTDTDFDITYSIQKPSTDTIAVDPENNPFRKDDGLLLFRPAGHGALLENLNDLDSSLIFIKNIDNVVPDRLKPETIKYKKILAGVLLDYQQKITTLLEKNKSGADITEDGRKLLKELGLNGNFDKETIIQKLDRPIRVCGMVKNEGEPGGGPFWVSGDANTTSLQIVEGAQIDQSNEAQAAILKQSTHFNPVDIVCYLQNYKGEKFDLMKYRDEDAGFITEKSAGGRKLKAMELPGLWNGSMSDWNTIFVEVPLITFNPVKTVNDLLRDEHQ